MDAGDIGIIITLALGFLAVLVAIWGQSRQWRADMEQLRSEFSHRISDVELDQARIEGANGTLSEVLKQQSHTHENTDD